VIRLSKLADYGIVMMTNMARHPQRQHNAAEIAAESHIPLPMASKILKALARAGLLASHRGAKGGYGLARDAGSITVAQVIVALDGPIALTSCIEDGPGDCVIEALCPARANWQRINDAIRRALDEITMAEMAVTVPSAFMPAIGRVADAGGASKTLRDA
jgi:FeS assembly SUF system regulator